MLAIFPLSCNIATVLKKTIACLAFLLAAGCTKDNDNPVKVTYAVLAADGSTLRITYHSDFYFDSGQLKPVDHSSTGGYWVASHLAYPPEDYFIRVDYLDSTGAESDYRVYVVFNDSLFVDSARFSNSVPVVELSGSVTY